MCMKGCLISRFVIDFLYAEFMWENEEDEEDENVMNMNEGLLVSSAASLASVTAC